MCRFPVSPQFPLYSLLYVGWLSRVQRPDRHCIRTYASLFSGFAVYSAGSTRTGISVVYTDEDESSSADTLSLRSLGGGGGGSGVMGSNPAQLRVHHQRLNKSVSEPCDINGVAAEEPKEQQRRPGEG